MHYKFLKLLTPKPKFFFYHKRLLKLPQHPPKLAPIFHRNHPHTKTDTLPNKTLNPFNFCKQDLNKKTYKPPTHN